MRLLRLVEDQQQPSSLPLDVIFVSLDLEVSWGEKGAMWNNTAHPLHVKELGIATLDTRCIFARKTGASQQTRAIETRQYSTSHASKDFEDCDITDFQECLFVETMRIEQDDTVPIINRSLRVQDTTSSKTTPGNLRPIVLVGHSIKSSINTLKRLGLDIAASPPVVAVLDTHALSHYTLAANAQPGWFTLSGVLTRLGCPHQRHELRNAGNEATYTLYAMLLLALRWSQQRRVATAREARNRELVRVFVNREIEAPRWEPVREALGAHAAVPGRSRPSSNTF